MKKLILLELAFLFFATTFSSNPPPPGWYQQTLPVNDFVNDIFFLDSLTGWIATNSDGSSGDTAYVMKTFDGGSNWVIQERSKNYYTKLQFLNSSIGYLCGSTGAALVWKTTNGGNTWFELFNFGLSFAIDDIQFINEDTGWVSSVDFDFGGIWKTTDGGNNWIRQLSPTPFPLLKIKAISMLNQDTGWAINNGTTKDLYRTTNGGTNWIVQYKFPSGLGDVYFFNGLRGVVSSGRFYNTTDGGFTWTASVSTETGGKLSFADDSTGWAGFNLIYIVKTTNGGITWFYQTTNVNNPTPFAITSQNAWAGGSGLVHTTDGGPLSLINQSENLSENYFLSQNYPNPFNPKTVISYELQKAGNVKLTVFDIQGKKIAILINGDKQAGKYETEFDARLAERGSKYSSGIYFYKLEISGKENYSDTKRMILLK